MKHPTKKRAKTRAWDACSQWVRLKEADEDGYVKCYTCDTVKYWKGEGMQAGHVIQGRGNSILFETDGIRPQCYGCNVRQRGRLDIMVPKIIDEIGRERYDELLSLKGKELKRSVSDYLALEIQYKAKINELTQ